MKSKSVLPPLTPFIEKQKEKEEKKGSTEIGLRTRRVAPRKIPWPKTVQKYIDKLMAGQPTSLTGEYFVNYYQMRDWIGPNGLPIRNWRAMVRCWLGYREDMAKKQAARRDRQTRREQCAERRRQNEQLSQNRQADTQRWLQQKAEHDATAVSYEEYLRMKGGRGKD